MTEESLKVLKKNLEVTYKKKNILRVWTVRSSRVICTGTSISRVSMPRQRVVRRVLQPYADTSNP